MALAINVATALLETTPDSSAVGTSTPLWVPLVIVALILLLLWWGLTRGRVYDENLPHTPAADEHGDTVAGAHDHH